MKKNKLSTANDKIYTPVETAKDIISKFNLSGKVLDPFKGGGAFYDNLPETVEKDWCEIDLGRDFFDYNEKVDWIISNPPYSIFGAVIEHSMEIADNIVYLIPLNKLTSSFTRVKSLQKFGGIPYMYIISPKKCNFPFGFCTCAVWLKRGYIGDTRIEVAEND
ncbi:MAG: hypothetical protein SPJ27_01425 [Candidatus Onthovivens sp.]|nr:hypothetical protein [Candidatus Onthovivens sp.]